MSIMNMLQGTAYFPYIRVLQDGEFLVDGYLHSQPCMCQRCLTLIFDAEAICVLLRHGESHTLENDGIGGPMRLTVTRRLDPDRALPARVAAKMQPNARPRSVAKTPAPRPVPEPIPKAKCGYMRDIPPGWRIGGPRGPEPPPVPQAPRRVELDPSKVLRARVREERRSRAEAATL
jgi:hypothetical protein